MLIDATLLVNDPEIIAGLLNGTLKRFGSVIREAGTGQIVRHLAETPGLTEKLMALPFNPVMGGASLVLDGIGHGVTIHKLNQVQRTLSSVLQLSQIAAGASVLNLGVSAIGFAYMGYKLHQIQKSLDTIQKSMEAGFDRIDERLNTLSGQLAYLHLLVEDSRQEQRRLGQAIAELHRAVLIKEMADLRAELLDRSRHPGSSSRETLKVASRVRMVLSDQAMQAPPELDARIMLIADIAIQGWAAATATEAYLLLEEGAFQEAQQVLSFEIPRFQDSASRWSSVLLADDRLQLSTAYRFAAPRFEQYITQERVERIAYISPHDSGLLDNQIRRRKNDAEVEFEMFHSLQLDAGWLHRQVASAEFLDSLSELSARLEGLQAFAEMCDRTEAKNSHELLPSNERELGLYLLPDNRG